MRPSQGEKSCLTFLYRPDRTRSETGMVFTKRLGEYDVQADGRLVACELSNTLRKELIYPTSSPASIRHRSGGLRPLQTGGRRGAPARRQGDRYSIGRPRGRR